MKTIMKIAMIAIMLSGITFSISNFISVELQSQENGLNGVWIAPKVCGGDGNVCDMGICR